MDKDLSLKKRLEGLLMAPLFTSVTSKYPVPPHLLLGDTRENGSQKESSRELIPVSLIPICHSLEQRRRHPVAGREHKGSPDSARDLGSL